MFNWSIFGRRNRAVHERSSDGTNIYYEDGMFTNGLDNIDACLNHPILTPAIVFITKLMCQAEIEVETKNTNEKHYEHDFIKLINNPNPLQSKDDFLTEVEFQKIANGVAPIYKKRPIGGDVDSIYVLDINYIKSRYDDEIIDTNQVLFRNELKKYLDTWLVYDDGAKKFSLQVKDLIFIKDLPNSKSTNLFNMSSRIDSIKQTLINTQDSLIAKNIILKTNGKELLTSGKSGVGSFPLSPQEKERVEGLVNKKYGVSFDRIRTIVSQSNLNWRSMHIALRDLGLDESIKIDSDIIFTALHIPKDIYSINNKKAAYKNFTESMIGFIQNNIKQEVDYIVNTIFRDLYEENNLRVFSSFSHIPIMKKSIKETYDGVEQQAKALKALLDARIPDDVALKMTGFDDSIKLNNYNYES